MKLETGKLFECGENGASGTTLPTAAEAFCAEKDWSRRCFYDRLCLTETGKNGNILFMPEWWNGRHRGLWSIPHSSGLQAIAESAQGEILGVEVG